MNTLTLNINYLTVNTSLENTQVVDVESTPAGTYEIIENEIITSNDFDSLVISGSLFSLTTFKNVNFESCTFFGSKIENCTFINCSFVGCKFEFTTISHSKFNKCNFESVLWDHSPLSKSTIAHCDLDANTAFFISEDENHVVGCTSPQEMTWEEALGNEAMGDGGFPPPIPEEATDNTVQLPIAWLTEDFKKAA